MERQKARDDQERRDRQERADQERRDREARERRERELQDQVDARQKIREAETFIEDEIVRTNPGADATCSYREGTDPKTFRCFVIADDGSSESVTYRETGDGYEPVQ